MKNQLDDLKDRLVATLRQHDVSRASYFGSYARGEATEKSAIDLLIEFEGTKSLFDLVDLQDHLESQLHKKFDLITFDSLHPLLRDDILAEQVELL